MSITNHSTAPGSTVHFEHYCEEAGCKKWGGFGHSPSKAIPVRWWCWEHFPYKSYEQEQALRKKLEAAERAARSALQADD